MVHNITTKNKSEADQHYSGPADAIFEPAPQDGTGLVASKAFDPSLKYVRARVIAEKYNVSSRHILKMAASGLIPSISLGKSRRFHEAAVAACLEQGGSR